MVSTLKDRVILVIEDERPLAEAIKAKLAISGCEAVTARTVEQALSYLNDQVKIDAIWLDHYLLGKENGLDFVAKIKEEGSQWKEVPIFVVSNTVSPEKVQTYLRLGANKYYTKANYRLDQIIGDIKEFLDNHKE